MASPNPTRPIISSSGYPRTSTLFDSMCVSAVFQGDGGALTSDRFVSSLALSGRPIEPIPEIAETRQDELVGGERSIDYGSVDVHVRVRGFDDRDAFRRRDDARDAHVARAGLR